MELRVSINGNRIKASDVKNFTVTDGGLIDVLNQIFARIECLDKTVVA